MSVSDDIEEELGVDLFDWQRDIIDAWFPPPPPPTPPTTWVRFKRWFRRVILRRGYNSVSLTAFDRTLRDVYGPGLRDSINQSNTLMASIHGGGKMKGQHAVWTIRDEAFGDD